MTERDETTEGSPDDPEATAGSPEQDPGTPGDVPGEGDGQTGAEAEPDDRAAEDTDETAGESASATQDGSGDQAASGEGGDERLFWYVLGVATGVVVVSALWFGYFIWLESDMSTRASGETATPPSFVRSSSYRRASRRAGRLDSAGVTRQLAGLSTSAAELSGLGETARNSGVLLLDLGGTDGPTLRSRLTGIYGAGELRPLVGAPLEQLLELAEEDASGLRWSELALVEQQRTQGYLTGVAERAAGAARRYGLSLAVVEPPVEGELEDAAAKTYLALLIRELYRRGAMPVVEMLPGARLPERVPALLITPESVPERSQAELVTALRDRGYEGLILVRPPAQADGESAAELVRAGADCVLAGSGTRSAVVSGLNRAPFTRRVSTASRVLAVKSELGLLDEGDSLFPPLTRFEPVEPVALERLLELRGVAGPGGETGPSGTPETSGESVAGEAADGETESPGEAMRSPLPESGEGAEQESDTGDPGTEQPGGGEGDRSGAGGAQEGREQQGEQNQVRERVPPPVAISRSRWSDPETDLREESWLLVTRGDTGDFAQQLRDRGANLTDLRLLTDPSDLPGIIEGREADSVLVVLVFPEMRELRRIAGMDLPLADTKFLTVWSETSEDTPAPGRYGHVEVQLPEGSREFPAAHLAAYLTGGEENR